MKVNITRRPPGFKDDATIVRHIQEALPYMRGEFDLRIQKQIPGSAGTRPIQVKNLTKGGVKIVLRYAGNDTHWECSISQAGVTPAELRERLEKKLSSGRSKRSKGKEKPSKRTETKDSPPRPASKRESEDDPIDFDHLMLLLDAIYVERGRRSIGQSLLQSVSESNGFDVAIVTHSLISRSLIRRAQGVANLYNITPKGVDLLRESGLIENKLSESLTKAQQLEAARGCRAGLEQYRAELEHELAAVKKELEEWNTAISELED